MLSFFDRPVPVSLGSDSTIDIGGDPGAAKVGAMPASPLGCVSVVAANPFIPDAHGSGCAIACRGTDPVPCGVLMIRQALHG